MKFLAGFVFFTLVLSAQSMEVPRLDIAAGDQREASAIRIDHAVRVESQSLLDIFVDLLRGTGVHGGFVELGDCSGSRKKSPKLKDGATYLKQGVTIHEAMDALVAANPSYHWSLDDGIVTLTPRVGVAFLQTKIAHFQMDTTDDGASLIIQDILRLPEVRQGESRLGLKKGLGQGGGPTVVDEHPLPRQPVPLHINVQNTSLQGAFNKAVRAVPRGIWVYLETDCSGDMTYTVEVTPG